MLKLLSKFKFTEYLMIILSVILMYIQVNLELKIPDYMKKITELINTDSSTMNEILKQGLYMIGCSFGSLVLAIIGCFIAAYLSSKFSFNLRNKIFKKVQAFSTTEIKKFQTSSLITRTTNDVTQFEMFIAMGLSMIIRAPLMAFMAVSKILNENIEMSILVGCCVLILLITISIIMFIVMPRFEKVQKLIDKVNGVTRENLTGIRVIKAFNAEEYQTDRFEEVNNDLTNTQLFNQRVFAVMNPIMTIVMNGLTLGIYIIGTILILNAHMIDRIDIFGSIMVFTQYGMQVIMSFLMLAMIFMMWPRVTVAAKRINEVLDEKLSIGDGSIKYVETEEIGTVEFKNVSFKYPDADEYLLKNISFKANQGDVIAFIGSTGSGKSTLINLIPRFYDTTEGEVLVDGINVKEYKLETLYNKIGYIPQKAVMFTGTIESNVSYGDTDNEISIEDINNAIEIAQASEFVNKMEDGINSHIARGGTNISGGQKQRLSIARAIARKPEIYIFDDSFSALDYKTDSVLRKALKEYTEDSTMLIVAQRIGTIINADKIIVLDNGECVGIGTHKELMENCEVYKEIALSQLSKEELENA